MDEAGHWDGGRHRWNYRGRSLDGKPSEIFSAGCESPTTPMFSKGSVFEGEGVNYILQKAEIIILWRIDKTRKSLTNLCVLVE